MALTGKTPGGPDNTYKGVLTINNDDLGLTSGLRNIKDGLGNNTGIQLSNTTFQYSGILKLASLTGDTFPYLDSTNTLISSNIQWFSSSSLFFVNDNDLAFLNDGNDRSIVLDTRVGPGIGGALIIKAGEGLTGLISGNGGHLYLSGGDGDIGGTNGGNVYIDGGSGGANIGSVYIGHNNTHLVFLKGVTNLESYGSGTNTGTATYNLAVDSTGKIIEVSTSGGSPSLTATYIGYGNGSNVLTGTSNFVFVNSSTRLGVGTSSPSATIHAISTTEQMRLGYDSSHYLSTTIGSGGNVSFSTNTGTKFTFNTEVQSSVASPGSVAFSALYTTFGVTLTPQGAFNSDYNQFIFYPNTGNDTAMFQVQNHAGSTLFNIDTTNNKLTSSSVLLFSGYGSGTHTGTVAYILAVDSSGNVIETSSGGGGGITIGTTAISGGASGRILYEKSDNTITELSGFDFNPSTKIINVGDYAHMGYAGTGTLGAFWCGSGTPDLTNFIILGGAYTVLNAVSSGIYFDVAATDYGFFNSTGFRIGDGNNPAALLDLKHGTTSRAPIMFEATSSALLSSIALGALEFVDDGTNGHLYITRNIAGVLTRTQIV